MRIRIKHIPVLEPIIKWRFFQKMQGLILVLFMALNGCIEPFDPVIKKYDELLVVDGMITEGSGPFIVRLSRSSSYNSIYIFPEEGAMVRILDDQGNEAILVETDPGIYATEPDHMEGVVGRSYSVDVATTNGNHYMSEPVKMKHAPAIEDLYYTYVEESSEDAIDPIQGIQVYLNSKDPDNNARYYRWEYVETWEFHPPISSTKYLNRYTCWQQDSSQNIAIVSTNGLLYDIVENHPIHFVSNETDRLKIRYSIQVKQFVLDEKTYNYWKQIEKINEGGGTMYDITPVEVKGNISNINDSDEPVLGYFQVCGLSTARIFVDREDLPVDFHAFSRSDCELIKVPAYLSIADYLQRGLFYIDTVDDIYNGLPERVHRFSNKPSCFDCTVTASNKIPDFWIDE